jgi:hypothetical protein
MVEVVENMLEDGPDAELEALFEKHGGISRDELRDVELELAQAMVSDVFGKEVLDGANVDDVESLMRHVHGRVKAQVEAKEAARLQRAEARAAQGRKSKADLAAERKAQAAREAAQSVREVYRKLASALHPDRETDTAERQRKTLLMQRANQAYERNDLLELLTLQIETEQIDSEHLATVSQVRLRHYNEVLREQANVLDSQILECAAPMLVDLGLSPHETDTRVAEAALTARIAQIRTATQHIERDLHAFDDARALHELIDALARQDAEDVDPFEAALHALMAGGMHGEPARPRGRKRRG